MIDRIALAVKTMAHSPINNYIAAGLTSSLIGGDGRGKVRLFQSDRDTRDWITPHSHRFSFTCLVLTGSVANILFTQCWGDRGNRYCKGTLRAVGGGMGGYGFEPGTDPSKWEEEEHVYKAGDTYRMTAEMVHSIRFSQGASVLFFEEPETVDHSFVLEPWSYGRRIPTFVTLPWMFERAAT